MTERLRSDYCGELRSDDIGRTVSVCGWVDRRREHSQHLAFIDLRDRTGIIQCVVDGSHDLRSEFVVRIRGVVRARPDGTVNPDLATGRVEIGDAEVEVLNTAEPPPFPMHDRTDVDETIRLRHRYVDLRKDRLQRNLQVRAKVNSAVRNAMERQGQSSFARARGMGVRRYADPCWMPIQTSGSISTTDS